MQIPWQTSWGFTTRSIGVMVMVHSDDVGLVLPPRIAPIQVVLVPIVMSGTAKSDTAKAVCHALAAQLRAAKVRVHVDDRDDYNPGWKYNYWELKGVPIRLEIGPKDVEMQHELLAKATATRDAALKQVTEWKDFVPTISLG